jgi:L,D-transpeptidase YcbB
MRQSLPLLSLLLLLIVAMSALPVLPTAAEAPPPGLRGLLESDSGVPVAGRPVDRATLLAFYRTRDFAPVWVDAPGREAALVHALAGAAEHGLDPAVFGVPAASPHERELLLTDALLRYAGALAQGRVSSAKLEDDWALPAPAFAPETVLEAAASGDPAAVLAALAPSEPGYRQLQQALSRYQKIAAQGGWSPLADGPKLKRGVAGPAVAALRRRLAAEDYLPPDAPAGDFDKPVETAVKRFQSQHGVADDGEVGAATLQALNVSAVARVTQIRANLERWRELPRGWPKSRIEVNVPAATLTVIEDGAPKLAMRTIVGADDHPTPVLQARMTAVLFNPPWRIPASIVTKEILPHLKQDPRYLERNHYVRVGAALQQLPGDGNALGHLKFETPNIYDVYLHDTPTHPLFGRATRNLSHGCVRLENPRQLALYVLADREGWGAEQIDRAISGGSTERVTLAHPRSVYLLYWTAFVDPDGTVEFRDDIYDRDHRLAAALASRDAAERLDPVTTLDQTAAAPSH